MIDDRDPPLVLEVGVPASALDALERVAALHGLPLEEYARLVLVRDAVAASELLERAAHRSLKIEHRRVGLT